MSVVGAEQGPAWMNEPVRAPTLNRTGAHKRPGSGLSTALFFGAIVAVVAAAGGIGIALWGPDKAPTNRTRLATDPPAPTTLPSLPEERAPAVADPPAEPAAPSEAPPVKKAAAKPKPKAKPR